jgi:hypothetical protein
MAQKTFVALDVLSASDINTYLTHEGGAWTSHTPTWTQGATITHTVNYSKYARAGRLITWTFSVTATSAGTAANEIQISIPATAASTSALVGSSFVYDTSTGTYYAGSILGQNTTELQFVSAGGTNTFGVNPAVTIASGDVWQGTISYEAAA